MPADGRRQNEDSRARYIEGEWYVPIADLTAVEERVERAGRRAAQANIRADHLRKALMSIQREARLWKVDP